MCSRSLVFEPKDFDMPLLKIKYSNNILLKIFKNVTCAKLKALLNTQLKGDNFNETNLEKEV